MKEETKSSKPPLGLMPKKIHDLRVNTKRLNEVRGAIARYYDAGLKINVEWIEEYNELIESVGNYYHQPIHPTNNNTKHKNLKT